MSETDVAEAANEEALPQVEDGEQQNDTDARARRLGWVPKDEFKGDPARWRPADEFLERGEQQIGIARENNRKLQDQLDRMSAEMAAMRDGFGEFREFASKAEERAYKRAKTEIEQQMDAAFQSGDAQAFNAAKTRMAEVETEYKPPAPKKDDKPQVHPDVLQWIDENQWFNTDPVLRAIALDAHERIGREKPGLSHRDNLAQVKSEVIRRYPEKFGNPRREAASMVDEPGGAPPPRKPAARSYENLPREAKAQCDKFMKQIPGYTREAYCQQYDWS